MERPWLRFYDKSVPSSLDYPQETLVQTLDRAVRNHGDAPATLFHNRRLNYRDLGEQVERFSTGLIGSGLEGGERIAIMLPNLPQFPIAFYGALRAGLIVVPTNPLYRPRELAHQLVDSRASAVVTLPQLLPTVLEGARDTHVRLVIVAEVADALPLHLRTLYRLKNRSRAPLPKTNLPILSWVDATRRRGGAGRESNVDGIAVLQYTGGTTGVSKGAMLTHRNLVANALQVFVWQGQTGGRVATLCVAPFFHVYGLTVGMNMTIRGHGLMLLLPRFEPETVRLVLRRHKPNLFPGVPTMYIALSSLPDAKADDFRSLETCISGAAPLPAEVQDRFVTLSPGARLVEGYGLTEASPVTHCNPMLSNRTGTVGVPFPDTDAAVVSPDSWDDVPVGEVGEVIVKGPQVMLGYWNRPEETERVIRNGWLRTGDLGTRDGDGYFCIVDRIKDVIIAGGYNVYPREVEEVLFRHPAVLEASAVGWQSAYRGETVKAFIVLKPGAAADTASIVEHCKTELAAYKVPKIVEFVDELPKSLVGKVLRRKLREMDTGSGDADEALTAATSGPADGVTEGTR